MPNFDGGHYFLTMLAPVRNDDVVTEAGEHVSYEQSLRMTLATLPTALQSQPSIETGINSPFARNGKTHFARFSVINNPAYNGRTPSDPILNAIDGTNPINPQPVDVIGSPFLLLSLDFDAADGSTSTRDSYLTELWEQMGDELRVIFEHCYGFKMVTDAAGFCRYVDACQLETTMSFNDYWITPPPLPVFPTKFWGFVIGIPALATVISLVMWLFEAFGANTGSLLGDGWSWGGLTLIGLGITALMIYLAYRSVMKAGAKPFPTAPNSDLKSVLKAIYLQQRFVDFVIDNQGKPADELHKAFGAFLAANKPSDLDTPTQTPGVLASLPGDAK
jgi:hypothetical protein